MDSGVLALIHDEVLGYGGDYRIDRLDVGRAHDDESYARIIVSAEDAEALQRLLMRLQAHGVNQVDPGQALLRPCDRDGVFPDDFYSTTNLETVVRLDGDWVPVEQAEIDCGLVGEGRGGAGAGGGGRAGGARGRGGAGAPPPAARVGGLKGPACRSCAVRQG